MNINYTSPLLPGVETNPGARLPEDPVPGGEFRNLPAQPRITYFEYPQALTTPYPTK